MTFTFDESRFRALWRNADEALQLRHRLEEVLKAHSVSSFDGLGHLLDAVLPKDSPSAPSVVSGFWLKYSRFWQ